MLATSSELRGSDTARTLLGPALSRFCKSGAKRTTFLPRSNACMHPKYPVDEGFSNNFRRATDGVELAVSQHRNPVRKLRGLVEVMKLHAPGQSLLLI